MHFLKKTLLINIYVIYILLIHKKINAVPYIVHRNKNEISKEFSKIKLILSHYKHCIYINIS